MIEIPAPIKKSRACVEAARAARKQSMDQQKLVLRYPDIAKRLCEPPFRYATPGQWNGYIPPAYDAERMDGVTPLNESPYRAALMAILEAAAEREDYAMRGAA